MSHEPLHRRNRLAGSRARSAGLGEVAIVIAMKRLEEAKTRLSPTYSAAHRSTLVIGMLTDTIEAVLAARAVESVLVVTADETAAGAARDAGARILRDPTPRGHADPLNAAIRTAEKAVRDRAPNVAVLHGDLPALRGGELEDAIAAASAYGRSFVRDRHGTGTSTLFAFGTELNPAFGLGSPLRHIATGAADLGGDWPGLRCDVDTPADLQHALGLGVGRATRRAAHRIGAGGGSVEHSALCVGVPITVVGDSR
ncbi:2-phospho-L-lactate guanylyltransferase [Nocardia sp. NPDC050408]|uniref:2-phospho-L-lactate guanylyltransferase n=1 Tax=Nocardia sp. NPDC050408 TaxID=3364319 RepID=UPI0037ADC169